MQSKENPPRLRIEAKVQTSGGFFGQLLAAILGIGLLVGAVFLSVFVFVGLAIAGVVIGGWLWWRTRKLRRQFRAAVEEAEKQMASRQAGQTGGQTQRQTGEVIEGDFIRSKTADDTVPQETLPIDRKP